VRIARYWPRWRNDAIPSRDIIAIPGRFSVGSALSLIWTVTTSTTLLQTGNGLLQVLLPLRMQADGLSIAAIGVVAAAYGFGFASGCFLAPAFVRHVGHIRAFASLAAVAAVVALAFTLAHSLAAWVALRALTGLALAGLFTVTDGWISARATTGNRGRVLSIYMVCTKIALMLSPLAIGLGNIRDDGLFMLVSAVMCISLLPVSATTTEAPAAPRTVRLNVANLFELAPSAVIGSFVVGLVNGPVIAIAPIYGVGIGMSQEQAAALLLALQGGSLLLQWPFGALSDRRDRRYVIAGLAIGTGFLSLAILAIGAGSPPLLVLLAFGLWGGVALCIYPVCVAHACDLVEPDRIVPTVGALLVSWAAGVTLGPIPGSLMMERFGPGGLFIYAAAISFVLAAFIVARIALQSRPKPIAHFVDLAPTNPATPSLDPRGEAGPETPAGSSDRPEGC
jgi:MFS family permease